jgi:hypothetical protein
VHIFTTFCVSYPSGLHLHKFYIYRSLPITLRLNRFRRTPLDEWSACHTVFYLTKHIHANGWVRIRNWVAAGLAVVNLLAITILVIENKSYSYEPCVLTWNVILIVWAQGRVNTESVHADSVHANSVHIERVNYGSRRQERGKGKGGRVAFLSLMIKCGAHAHAYRVAIATT